MDREMAARRKVQMPVFLRVLECFCCCFSGGSLIREKCLQKLLWNKEKEGPGSFLIFLSPPTWLWPGFIN